MNKSKEDLKAMIEHILYTFTQTASHYVWIFAERANPLFQSLKPYELRMLHNASLESSLINLRAMNEFFTPSSQGRSAKSDDIRADNYPNYSTKGAFLDEDLTEIHKRLAHITLQRLTPHKGWQIKLLMNPAIDRMLDFLNYLRSDFLSLSDPELEAVISLQKSLSELVLVQFPDLGTQCNLRHD